MKFLAQQLAVSLNQWASNQVKRKSLRDNLYGLSSADKQEFQNVFNYYIEYDYEFTNDNF